MPQLLLLSPLIIAFDVVAAGYGVALRRDRAALWGRLEALYGLAGALRKRRRAQKKKTVTWNELGLARLESPLNVLERFRHLRSSQPTLSAGTVQPSRKDAK